VIRKPLSRLRESKHFGLRASNSTLPGRQTGHTTR
jgi:hypothetical protein